jgi:alpha-methylacyl-CoA racemase
VGSSDSDIDMMRRRGIQVVTGPLVGVRVIELGGIGPVPFACMQLAGLGAEVIRVDRLGDDTDDLSPMRRGKKSIALDLKHADSVDAVLGLVESCDVLVEGFRPGVAERLGLGPEECWARNERLVYGRLTGWGQTGSTSAGHDISYIAMTGALHAIGREGQPPGVPLCLLGDLAGGAMYLVTGVLAALIEARSSGRGQIVDAAIVDGVASLMAPIYGMGATGQWRDERGVNTLDTGRPWYDVYRTHDGKWLAVGALEDRFYAELLRILDIDVVEGDRSDPAGWPELRRRIAGVIATRTRDEWVEAFAGSDACVSPVLSMSEAAVAAENTHRDVFVDIGGIRQPAPAPRFSHTPTSVPSPPARIGEHTREILGMYRLGVRAASEA